MTLTTPTVISELTSNQLVSQTRYLGGNLYIMGVCKARSGITGAFVKDIFEYDSSTGFLTWRVSRHGRVKIGDRAGCIAPDGRRKIEIHGQSIAASALIWLWMTGEWPTKEIDHINRNKDDDRWDNLRLATHQQNMANKNMRSDNKSGFRGVYKRKSLFYKKKPYEAQIRINGKLKSLGYYHTAEEASEVYKVAQAKAFGEFAGPDKR